jgi:hypothetical protein
MMEGEREEGRKKRKGKGLRRGDKEEEEGTEGAVMEGGRRERGERERKRKGKGEKGEERYG